MTRMAPILRPIRIASLVMATAIATTAIATTAMAQDKIRLAHPAYGIFRLPLYVALHNGYFKQQGVEVEMIDTASGSNAMKMLAGGSVDVTVGQVVDAVNLQMQDFRATGVFMMTSRFTNSIVVAKPLAKEIKKLSDLKGRPLGITGVGSGTWQFAMFNAVQEGMNPDQLNFISLGGGPTVMGAVKSGRVAALSYAEPETLQLVKDGDAEMMIDMGDPATHERLIGKDYVNNWVIMLDSYTKEHPKTVQNFVNAMQQAQTWLKDHSPADIAKVLKTFSGFQRLDDDVLTQAIARQGRPGNGIVTRSALENSLKLPRAVGALKRELTFEQLVNNTFAEKAAKANLPAK